MSEKLLPCPFCGGESNLWHNPPHSFGVVCDACGCEITGPDNTRAGAIAAWNRRTPAPEGEASLWGCADGNGIDPRLVFRDRPTAEQVAADMNMVVQPLYASPVVPVGVSERMDEVKSWVEDAECSRGCSSWRPDVHGRSRCDCGRGDALEATDAILAALRPTDTGRE